MSRLLHYEPVCLFHLLTFMMIVGGIRINRLYLDLRILNSMQKKTMKSPSYLGKIFICLLSFWLFLFFHLIHTECDCQREELLLVNYLVYQFSANPNTCKVINSCLTVRHKLLSETSLCVAGIHLTYMQQFKSWASYSSQAARSLLKVMEKNRHSNNEFHPIYLKQLCQEEMNQPPDVSISLHLLQRDLSINLLGEFKVR